MMKIDDEDERLPELDSAASAFRIADDQRRAAHSAWQEKYAVSGRTRRKADAAINSVSEDVRRVCYEVAKKQEEEAWGELTQRDQICRALAHEFALLAADFILGAR